MQSDRSWTILDGQVLLLRPFIISGLISGLSLWLLAYPLHLSGAQMGDLKPPSVPLKIKDRLSTIIYQKATVDREVISVATLEQHHSEDIPNGEWKKYHFDNLMLAHASVRRAYEVLTQYEQYKKLIPYIDQAIFNPQTRILNLKGSIWKFELQSQIRFQEHSPERLGYEVVSGHFLGLKGEMLFEQLGEDCLVYFYGDLKGNTWPPKLIAERGAEVVFQMAGNKMRGLIESKLSFRK